MSKLIVDPIKLLVSVAQFLMLLAFLFTEGDTVDAHRDDTKDDTGESDGDRMMIIAQAIVKILGIFFTLVGLLASLPRISAVLSGTETSLNPEKKTRVGPVSDAVSDTTK